MPVDTEKSVTAGTFYFAERRLLQLGKTSEENLQLQIERKIPEFVKELSKGKHIEIHATKDGVKFFVVDKKILKQFKTPY